MQDINREIFVFYQKDSELYQVSLKEHEEEIIKSVLLSLHDGVVKIMPDKFCDIHRKEGRRLK